MTQLQVKFGRELVWIDENDVILDNGFIVQIMTKTKVGGWDNGAVRIARNLFKQFKACGFIKEYTNYPKRVYNGSPIDVGTYYKFDIDAMKKLANTAGGYPMREVE